MTDFQDAWFLLQHSAQPVVTGVVFFLLGLSYAFLLWHRWVRHLHQWERENRGLEAELTRLKEQPDGSAGQRPDQDAASADRSLIAEAASAFAERAKSLDEEV